MQNRPQKKNASIQQVLTALLDEQNVFPPAYLHHFSDLEGADLEAVRSVWLQTSSSRRYNLLEDLEELAETDTLVSFDALAKIALQDPEPRVRTIAIRLLWESEDPRLARNLIKILENDDNADVRATAASGLGSFVYQGELEELDEDVLHLIEDKLLQVINGTDVELVRRRALEAMGFSSRDEIPALIRKAYDSNDPDWVTSALFAMGRSADSHWEPQVKRMLNNPKVNIQLEAIRAAGELGLQSTRRILLDLLEEEAQDSDVRSAVFWSLSQIGGEEVRETLEKILEETEDDEEADILSDALDNLSFTEDAGLYSMFDMDRLGEANALLDDDYQDVEKLAEEEEYSEDESPKPKPNKSASDEDSGSTKGSRHRHHKSS